jgi:hypothetical protein
VNDVAIIAVAMIANNVHQILRAFSIFSSRRTGSARDDSNPEAVGRFQSFALPRIAHPFVERRYSGICRARLQWRGPRAGAPDVTGISSQHMKTKNRRPSSTSTPARGKNAEAA